MKLEDEKIQLGNEYYATRKALGMTQVEFAKKLGMTQSKLSKVEHGQLEPGAIQDRKFLEMKGKRFL
jgi:transcriptional regulator with XRE-family HTH domain